MLNKVENITSHVPETKRIMFNSSNQTFQKNTHQDHNNQIIILLSHLRDVLEKLPSTVHKAIIETLPSTVSGYVISFDSLAAH
jgi:hypothetical protein